MACYIIKREEKKTLWYMRVEMQKERGGLEKKNSLLDQFKYRNTQHQSV